VADYVYGLGIDEPLRIRRKTVWIAIGYYIALPCVEILGADRPFRYRGIKTQVVNFGWEIVPKNESDPDKLGYVYKFLSGKELVWEAYLTLGDALQDMHAFYDIGLQPCILLVEIPRKVFFLDDSSSLLPVGRKELAILRETKPPSDAKFLGYDIGVFDIYNESVIYGELLFAAVRTTGKALVKGAYEGEVDDYIFAREYGIGVATRLNRLLLQKLNQNCLFDNMDEAYDYLNLWCQTYYELAKHDMFQDESSFPGKTVFRIWEIPLPNRASSREQNPAGENRGTPS